MNFTCDICHASRPTSELAPFDLLNLTACRQCVRERQSAPPETCPYCGAKCLHGIEPDFITATYACDSHWLRGEDGEEPSASRSRSCLKSEITTLRFALRDCLPYLSTARSIGEIEARGRALSVLGEVQSEPTEPAETK